MGIAEPIGEQKPKDRGLSTQETALDYLRALLP